ncbi:MAG: DNA-directed RNA polymerase subunit omega [Bacteroidales bacterium]|nr:DNA-directed RNA polymerase subunit omega [Bacteroidales bacterium]
MTIKKKHTPDTTVTRNIYDLSQGTENIYETVAMLSKRANQISIEEKKELHKKIDEFSSNIDTMEEMFENREQIEIVRHFELMPKPTLEATEEYLDGDMYYRNPAKDDANMRKLEAEENEALAKKEMN